MMSKLVVLLRCHSVMSVSIVLRDVFRAVRIKCRVKMSGKNVIPAVDRDVIYFV